MNKIKEDLLSLQDIKYRDFQCQLIPGADKNSFIGVRTPLLRKYAKEIIKSGQEKAFLKELPHKYFDENQLHAFILSEIRDFDVCINEVCRFLPFIDNWATCDQLSPKVFKKHKSELLIYIKRWVHSDKTYTVRFGLGMLLNHFLEEGFKSEYLDMAAEIKSDEYYINMMIAWLFATALAKQYDTAIKYIQNKRLSVWVHNKTIQKAVESYRITDSQKEHLKGFRIKKGERL